MEIFEISDLNFCYPQKGKKVLRNINLKINKGEFITLCGQSGSGKTTLLKHLKPALTPYGEKKGTIRFLKKDIDTVDDKTLAQKIGFVFQNPDNQIVTDKVWHELAFGLESLGLDNDTMQIRIAEIAAFFGISSWFYSNTSTLSGGQKQILNLASIMVMQPDVLILDEPTSQLDPVCSSDFIHTVKKINEEIGTTIIMTEHRLEDVLPISDRVIVMDDGEIIADDTPSRIGEFLKSINHKMFSSMTSAMQIYSKLQTTLDCPVSVKDGCAFLDQFLAQNKYEIVQSNETIDDKKEVVIKDVILELSDIWFRYEKNSLDILQGVDFKLYKNTIHAILGSNGAGKSTLLSVISKNYTPYRGRIKFDNKNYKKIKNKEYHSHYIAILPQNPQYLFVKDTVYEDLKEALEGLKLSDKEKDCKIDEVANLVEISDLLEYHPYDISGGEQQRAALAKVLLLSPKFLIMDEPTKGFDSFFKEKFSQILNKLKNNGVTILLVSHDIEFCAKHVDFISMMINGRIITTKKTHDFFNDNYFYTTAANRISRNYFKNVITNEEVVSLCQKIIKQ